MFSVVHSRVSGRNGGVSVLPVVQDGVQEEPGEEDVFSGQEGSGAQPAGHGCSLLS